MKIKIKWETPEQEVLEKAAYFGWEIKLRELDHLGYLLQKAERYAYDRGERMDIKEFGTKLRELYKAAKLKLIDNEVESEIILSGKKADD